MDYSHFRKKLGERIRILRKEKEIKQEQLAELVDKSTEHISFIERGERSPSLELLIAIAREDFCVLWYVYINTFYAFAHHERRTFRHNEYEMCLGIGTK